MGKGLWLMQVDNAKKHSKTQDSLNIFISDYSVYIVTVILFIIGMFVSPEFLTSNNLINILNAIAVLGTVAVGVSFVTYSGNMADLSVPVIMAFSGIITIQSLSLGLFPALILGILAGLLIGFINGIVVGYFDANGILWTLAMAFAMKGFMRYMNSNNMVYPNDAPGTPGAAFVKIFRVDVGPIPLPVFIMILTILIGHFVMKKTKFGIHSKLVGISKEVARCSGINEKATVLFAFMMSALTSSIGGILITSMNKLGVYHLGEGYDFQAVTAIVLGGITLAGGRGNMFGLLGGVLVIGLLDSIMTFIGIGTFSQNIITGIVFILVVGLNLYNLRRMGKDYE